uniref:ATP-binding cassette sub-family F member 3 (Trinotate prediction) n=1 Tax=Henneguya salminicola TaxID=69463 RepID=A0A6G3MG99_HENSL
MLDLKSLYWLKNFLPEWQGTLVIVSHDRHFLDSVCTDIIHLTGQTLEVYRGNYTAFECTRREKHLRQKREYEAQAAHRKHVKTFIDRFNAGTRAASVQSRIKALEKLPDLKPPEEEPEVVLRFLEIEEVSKNLIQLDNVFT